MILFGGENAGQYLNDVQALSFPSMYPLTLSTSPLAGGSVQSNPSGTCQIAGSMVTITATPAANYTFTGWSGDASGTTNPLTVTMDAAKNITANFATYELTTSASPPRGRASTPPSYEDPV